MSSKQSDAWIALYVTDRLGFIPTEALTNAGFYLQVEPVRQVNYWDLDELTAALQNALENGNPEITVPPGVQQHEFVMGRYLGVSGQDEFEKATIPVRIEEQDDHYTVRSWKKLASGKWENPKNLALNCVVAKSAGAKGIAAAIIEHLKSRRDLPGMTFDFQQPKTAKGA